MDAITSAAETGAKAGKACGSVLGVALAIFLIVIGAIHKDDCTGAPNLGPSLIIVGALSIVTHIFQLCKICCDRGRGYEEISDESSSSSEKCLKGLVGIVGLIGLGFFIYLCVLVYGLDGYVNYEDHADQYYCNQLLYLSAFWMITISLGVLGILLALAILLGICAVVCAST